ncbi:hypothetical protein NTE_02433 [Candidatus Nitrososphaera evergladensis SR1]|jgi:hypothetical protein|uniref:Uncharacterized protein n=1 Tax=Candidatus Nitrososphaera evergladensis SR1 TaxID=1459636 RepID=A0A075MTM5_9ARCH|nr:hypothetical protein [Candidatus Nitrososphaera evergladensis]AIF84483.1 hypothetical protein NTE_02433 [Candidatus Nitrososphaera evergladensis SR1]
MISSIVIFVLAFAALGLLLGYASVFDVQPQQHERAVRADIGSNNNNGTSITLGEQVNVQVQSAG